MDALAESVSAVQIEELEPLDEYLCPITHELFKDPVTASDGHSYEREAISKWIERGNLTSPKSGSPLASTMLFPNYTLRCIIQDWSEKRRSPDTGPLAARPDD